jgi:TusA-related sulfurtransferase
MEEKGDEPVMLTGRFCPYPVVCVIEKAEVLRSGESCTFVVDDPMAIKSIPEELEELGHWEISIQPIDNGWSVHIMKP